MVIKGGIQMKTAEILTYKRIGEKTKDNYSKTIILAIIGLLAGRVEIWGIIMPTGIGWVIANKEKKNFLYAIICSMAGILLSGMDIFKIRSVASLAVVLALYKTEEELFRKNSLITALIGGVANFISGSIIIISGHGGGFDYILLAIETVLIAGSAISFENAISVISRGGTILNDEEAISAFLVAGCVAAGLSGIGVFGVKLSAVAALYMIMLTARKNGCGISVTLSAVLGIACGGEYTAEMLTMFIFTAICCSLFSAIGKYGILIGAALANTAYTACGFGGGNSIAHIIEITMSALIFYATPNSVIDLISAYTSKKSLYSPGPGQLIRQKQEAEETIDEIQQAVSSVAQVVKEMNTSVSHRENREDIVAKVRDTVCMECALKGYCTGKNNSQLTQAVDYMMTLLEKRGVCIPEDVTSIIKWQCIHSGRVVDKVKDAFRFYREKNLEEAKTEKYREFAITAIQDMAEIIQRQKMRIKNAYSTYNDLSEEIAEALERNGIKCSNVCVTKTKNELFQVYCEILSGKLGQAESIIKDIMPSPMKTVCEEKIDKGTVLTLREKEHFKYDVAVLGLDNKDRRTGDTAIWFDDGKGYLHCMLSDGMGSGVEASKESGWTVKLFEKLSRAGFEPGESFRMINNVMIAGKPTESCISADAVKINLHSGNAELTKAGAAATFIKTKKGVEKVGWSSIPLGILEISETENRFVDMSEGGYVVLMSDGLPDTAGDRMEGEHLLRRALEQCDFNDAREVAEHMMFSSIAMGAPKDDMTIIVAKIIK